MDAEVVLAVQAFDNLMKSNFATKYLAMAAAYLGFSTSAVIKMARATSEAKSIETKEESESKITGARADQTIKLIEVETEIEIKSMQRRATALRKRELVREQSNIESILSKGLLYSPVSIDDASVDDDWIRKFFNSARLVSHEQMQDLWANILAREVANPGSFSLLTLEAVKTMDVRIADLFTKACESIWQVDDHSRILIEFNQWESDMRDENKYVPADSNLSATMNLRDLSTLTAHNLISPVEESNRLFWRMSSLPTDNGPSVRTLRYFDETFRVGFFYKPSYFNLTLTSRSLTFVGEQLQTICGAVCRIEHQDSVLHFLRSSGNCTIEKLTS